MRAVGVRTEAGFLDARRTPGRLAPRWNLVVPESVLLEDWEEPG